MVKIPLNALHQVTAKQYLTLDLHIRQVNTTLDEYLSSNLLLPTLISILLSCLHDKIVKWKSGLEAKGLKMNIGKTKVMFSCSMKDKVEEEGKWPGGVCKKGVGNNSILCHGCKKWIHKRCSGVKGSLHNASQSFHLQIL